MMFESALLESGGRLTTRQRWTSLATMAAQAAGVAGMVLASMMFTDTLPRQFLPTFVLPVPPAGRAAEPQRPPRPQSSAAEASRPGTFEAPRWIPVGVKRIVDAPQAPSLDDRAGVPGSPGPGGASNPIMNEITRGAAPALPKPPAAGVVRLSRPEPGALIYRVEPRYPPLALVTRTSGTVVLHATISPEGRIVNLEAVSGPPLLVPAALDAVQQWRYRPYVLNGQALAVETEIRVNFVLHP